MSLDFTQIDNNKNIIGHIPIRIEDHGKIFYFMVSGKFQLLERIRDYYSDVLYSTDELPELSKELICLKNLHLENTKYLSLINSMIKLVEEAILMNYQIEVIAD
jgi:hypothetical protein